jgi:hypothetical protein
MIDMRTSVVRVEDLVNFFSGETGTGDYWTSSKKDGGLDAECDHFDVSLRPDSAVYNVKIRDKEDPTESAEEFTEKPVDFIINFMGTGTTGDEYFKSMASVGPNDLRDILIRLSSEVRDEKIGPRELKRVLRRAMVMADVEFLRRVLSTSVRLADVGDFEMKEIANLQSEMAGKGWKVKVDEDRDGNSVLSVDIGDKFEVKIKVDHRLWNYVFKVNNSDFVEKGISDDPIFTFQEFRKSRDTRDAINDMNDAMNTTRTRPVKKK